jgi:hypothetical protein
VAVQQARQDGADRPALADVILKLAGEVRQQLGLQLQISRALVILGEGTPAIGCTYLSERAQRATTIRRRSAEGATVAAEGRFYDCTQGEPEGQAVALAGMLKE